MNTHNTDLSNTFSRASNNDTINNILGDLYDQIQTQNKSPQTSISELIPDELFSMSGSPSGNSVSGREREREKEREGDAGDIGDIGDKGKESNYEEVDSAEIDIVKYLGSGGEGKVFLGRVKSIGQNVAFKQFQVVKGSHEGMEVFVLFLFLFFY